MRIGVYEVVRELARGGQGAVLHARGPDGRDVAIKLLLHGRDATGVQQRRFAREVEALKRLRHPHVVGILDVGSHQGAPFLVMDYVPGQTLEDRLRQGPLPEARALELTRKLAEALQHAHERNVLHRDVKPENVIIDAHGEPWLTDFGLTRDVDPRLSGTQLSSEGRFMGTPGFLAPEQARGELGALSAQTDVFGLGATCYALLTGHAPFAGPSLLELLVAMESPPESPRALRPELSAESEAVCLRCLAYEPADRYRSAGDLAWELGKVLSGERILAPKRRRRWLPALALGSVLVGALAAGVAHARRPGPFEVAYDLVLHRRDFSAAVPILERLAAERPDDARVLALWGVARYLDRLDRPRPGDSREGAEELIARALTLDPRCALAHYGQAWLDLTDHARCLAEIEQAIALDPDEPEFYYFRGDRFVGVAKLDYDRALVDFDRALALDDTLEHVVERRASVLVWAGRYEEGAEGFTRLIELRPDDYEAWGQRASTKMKGGDPQGAVDDWSHALEMEPGFELGRIGRACMREQLGDLAGALDDYRILVSQGDEDFVDDVLRLEAALGRPGEP